ncbi:cilia- and flagella-associated protein 73 [Pogoniulus pusillus]|uniref:cilia- and flagella-associated protein 73 n=1 Tax=Pogoniulus pusillus TaxID=488313 RepID=UPI0030B93462
MSQPGLSPPRYNKFHMSHGGTVPVWDGATLLPSTRLLLKRREVAEVERALQSQQEVRAAPKPFLGHAVVLQEFQQRMEQLAQRRQQLGQREKQYQDVALKYDAFLKARQEQALQHADKERAQAAEQGAKAARLLRELEGLLQHRDRLALRLQSLQGFSDYLQAVLARAGQFQDVLALLAHFEALSRSWATLAREAEGEQEQLAEGWAQLQQHQEKVDNKLLSTSNEVPQLHECLEAAPHDVIQKEPCWAHVQSMAPQRTLLLHQIKLAVLNLFQLTTTWLKVPGDTALEDTEAQLDTVLLCMQDLAAICAELCPKQLEPRP